MIVSVVVLFGAASTSNLAVGVLLVEVLVCVCSGGGCVGRRSRAVAVGFF